MKEWALRRITYLISEGSKVSDKSGQTPMRPKYLKTFVNIETGQLSEVTDLETKIYKRNNQLRLFFKVYTTPFAKKEITIFSAVVNQDEYSTVGKFINTITRKFKRKGIERLGYVWFRDVGNIKCHKHFHILFATSRVSSKLFKKLFGSKKNNNYEVKFLKSPRGITNYLEVKELYGAKKQRAFGKSRKFPLKVNKLPLTRLKDIS